MIALDASVIAKWFIKEEKTKQSLQYQKSHLKGEETIVFPELAVYELANLFRYKKGFSEQDIQAALQALDDFDIEIFHFDFRDMIKVTIFAKENEATVYDSSYVVLASDLNSKLITADEDLFEKTKETDLIKLL